MKLNDNIWTAVLCSLTTGALFAASRDIAPFGPLILVAPIPILLYALASDRLWRVFAASLGARAIGAAALVYAYAGTLPTMALVAVIAAASVEFAVVMVLTRLATQRLPVWAATLSFPVFVTAAEFLGQSLSPHGTFGALGYALADVRALVQVASVGGLAAVSFIAALVPMALALLIRTPAQWRSVMAAGVLPVVVALVFGAWRLSLPYETRARVALVAIDSLTFLSVREPAQASHVADAYARAIASLEGQQLEAVVLPERVFVDATGTSADPNARLQDAANRIGVRIVAGFDQVLADGRHGNTAGVFSPQKARLTYVKRKLIPGLEQYRWGVQSAESAAHLCEKKVDSRSGVRPRRRQRTVADRRSRGRDLQRPGLRAHDQGVRRTGHVAHVRAGMGFQDRWPLACADGRDARGRKRLRHGARGRHRATHGQRCIRPHRRRSDYL
jgi:apolipoprotein N-acyltransferase